MQMTGKGLLLLLLLTLAGSLPVEAQQEEVIRPHTGTVTDNVYENAFFGFSYEFPKGWHVRGSATHRRIMDRGAELNQRTETEKEVQRELEKKYFYTLLTVSPEPEGAPGFGDAMVGVVAYDLSALPGVNTGEEYSRQLAAKAVSGPLRYEMLEEPHVVAFGEKEFCKMILKRQKGDATVYQASLVTTDKGFLLMFTVAAQSSARLDEVLKTTESIQFAQKEKQ